MGPPHVDASLSSKLRVPALQSEWLVRPRIMKMLDASIRCSLALICAQAGSGKTTEVAQRVHWTQRKVGWASLEKADNDPMRFWTLALEALESVYPGKMRRIIAFLQSARLLSQEELEITLLNALVAFQEEIVFVLDDYQLIEDPAIHRTMSALLHRLPASFHIVLFPRTEPVSFLRELLKAKI